MNIYYTKYNKYQECTSFQYTPVLVSNGHTIKATIFGGAPPPQKVSALSPPFTILSFTSGFVTVWFGNLEQEF